MMINDSQEDNKEQKRGFESGRKRNSSTQIACFGTSKAKKTIWKHRVLMVI